MARDESKVPPEGDPRREFFFDAKTGAPLSDEEWDHSRAIMREYGNDPFEEEE